MNKLISCILFTLVILLAGCSSQQEKVASVPETKVGENPRIEAKVKGGAFDMKREINKKPGEHLWIIREGFKGEAGLYNGQAALPIDKLEINMSIMEILAAVDLSISYPALDAADLEFRYPAFYGMLVRDFQVKVGNRHFRAVISEKESADEIYRLATQRGFNATLISQKAFGSMIVKTSIKEKSDVKILFSYTQLSAFKGKSRLLAIPQFKGLENASLSLHISGSFLSPLVSFSGLNRSVSGNKFSVSITDREILNKGLLLKYQTKELYPLSADGKTGILWDEKSANYLATTVSKKYLFCQKKVLNPVFAFLSFNKLIEQKRPFKEIQNFAIQSRLLTPLTRLLLVDTQK